MQAQHPWNCESLLAAAKFIEQVNEIALKIEGNHVQLSQKLMPWSL
jgi:hypothetical protein